MGLYQSRVTLALVEFTLKQEPPPCLPPHHHFQHPAAYPDGIYAYR